VAYDFNKTTFATEVLLSYSCKEHHDEIVSLLNEKNCTSEAQVVIHIVHYEVQSPSEVTLICVTFAVKFLMLPLLEHFQEALVRYRNISGSILV
jgi:hypothetical protein